MIIDSSAIVAIIQGEPEAERFKALIGHAERRCLSAASYLEIGIAVDRWRDHGLSRRVDEFIHAAGLTIEPLTEAQARIAREAYRDYGRGSGHPAGLNFGDCCAYALARDKNEPLLFKGDDFGHTDIRSALA